MKRIENYRRATAEEIEAGLPEMILVSSETVAVSQFHEVALWKLRAVLATMDLVDDVDAAIDQLPEPNRTFAKTSWEYGNVVSQSSETVQFLKSALSLTDDQFNEIFNNALNISI